MRQGYEPDVFRKTFPRWESFSKADLDQYEISEEDSDDESDEDDDSDEDQGSKATTSKAKSTAAATDAASEAPKELTAEQKKRVASYLPEAVWLNF